MPLVTHTNTKYHFPWCKNLWSLAQCKSVQRSFVFKESLKEQMFGNGSQQRLCCLKIPCVIYEMFNMKFQEAQCILSRPLTKGETKANSKDSLHPGVISAGSVPSLLIVCVLLLCVFVFPTHMERKSNFRWKDNLCLFPLGCLILLATNGLCLTNSAVCSILSTKT